MMTSTVWSEERRPMSSIRPLMWWRDWVTACFTFSVFTSFSRRRSERASAVSRALSSSSFSVSRACASDRLFCRHSTTASSTTTAPNNATITYSIIKRSFYHIIIIILSYRKKKIKHYFSSGP